MTKRVKETSNSPAVGTGADADAAPKLKPAVAAGLLAASPRLNPPAAAGLLALESVAVPAPKLDPPEAAAGLLSLAQAVVPAPPPKVNPVEAPTLGAAAAGAGAPKLNLPAAGAGVDAPEVKPPPDGAGAVDVLPKLKPVADAGALFVDGAPKLKAMVRICFDGACVGWST